MIGKTVSIIVISTIILLAVLLTYYYNNAMAQPQRIPLSPLNPYLQGYLYPGWLQQLLGPRLGYIPQIPGVNPLLPPPIIPVTPPPPVLPPQTLPSQTQTQTQQNIQTCDPTSQCTSTTQVNNEPNGKNVIGGITFGKGGVTIGGGK